MLFMKWNYLFFYLIFLSCTPVKTPTAEEIIKQSVDVYGWNQKEYSLVFDFRDYEYELIRKPSFYSYQRITDKKEGRIRDLMNSNNSLKRYIDDQQISLEDSIVKVYSNSLNSVLYFFQLPRPLLDSAVISSYTGITKIEDTDYWTLKVTFKEAGGGEDYQDEYRYWIDAKTHQIKYLAYNYLTDGGGTRFRVAKNFRRLGGFLFQDYTNFKPKTKFVSLDSLPKLYVRGKLEVVSQIENQNIRVSKP